VISIKQDLESTLLSFEENLAGTLSATEEYQKELILRLINEKYKNQFIKKQRRINALKSPFYTTLGLIRGILGGEQEEFKEKEIDKSDLENEQIRTKEIINSLEYVQLINYFKDTVKQGLIKTNNQWKKHLNLKTSSD
jgi:hypothetical protein